MKHAIFAAIGAVGSFIAGALGGWDMAIITLCSFMAIDYATGFIVAAVFHKSKKSASGGLKSHEGWKGLCKKGMILLLVVVANLLDKQTGANYVRDAVCIFFIANEGVSILENAALMGVPIPKWLSQALDVMQEKAEVPK
jgi:toxin secretion/phage lysis holin